jgi:hypothetical protein
LDDKTLIEIKPVNNPKTTTVLPGGKSRKVLNLYTYPFYNRLGCSINSNGDFEPDKENTSDINLYNPTNGIYTKDQIRSFLFLKNMVSLHTKDEVLNFLFENRNPDLIKIINNIKNSLGIKSRSDLKLGNIKIKVSSYNPDIDSPIGVFDNGKTKPLSKDELFVSIVREVEIGDKIGYITMSVFT